MEEREGRGEGAYLAEQDDHRRDEREMRDLVPHDALERVLEVEARNDDEGALINSEPRAFSVLVAPIWLYACDAEIRTPVNTKKCRLTTIP